MNTQTVTIIQQTIEAVKYNFKSLIKIKFYKSHQQIAQSNTKKGLALVELSVP